MPEDDKPNPLLGLLAVVETLGPIFETAKGIKAQLEADGWSPTAAEDVGREFMVGAMYLAMRGGRG